MGLGGFSGTTNVPVGVSPASVVIGDFNSDGNQDFASANQAQARSPFAWAMAWAALAAPPMSPLVSYLKSSPSEISITTGIRILRRPTLTPTLPPFASAMAWAALAAPPRSALVLILILPASPSEISITTGIRILCPRTTAPTPHPFSWEMAWAALAPTPSLALVVVPEMSQSETSITTEPRTLLRPT